MKQAGIGRWILSSAAALTAVGGYPADWNDTHLFNPNWPPHAKFHDAWTVLLGSLLGTGGLYFLWRKTGDPKLHLTLGAFLPALYWIGQVGSFVFPGTGGLDTEFKDRVPRIAGVALNEAVSSSLVLLLLTTGYALERRRMERAARLG